MAATTFPSTSGAIVLPSPDDSLYEIIDGERKELLPMSTYASIITSRLLVTLGAYVKERESGETVMETLFNLQAVRGRNRRPDVAFVSYEIWPKGKAIPVRQNAWDVTPDLAVEIIRPTDCADDVMEKLVEYFQAGVRQVWVIYAQAGLFYLYRSPKEVQIFDRRDELVCDDMFSEFRLKLNELFRSAEEP